MGLDCEGFRLLFPVGGEEEGTETEEEMEMTIGGRVCWGPVPLGAM